MIEDVRQVKQLVKDYLSSEYSFEFDKFKLRGHIIEFNRTELNGDVWIVECEVKEKLHHNNVLNQFYFEITKEEGYIIKEEVK